MIVSQVHYTVYKDHLIGEIHGIMIDASDSRYIQNFKKSQKSYCTIFFCSGSESESENEVDTFAGDIGLKLKFYKNEVYYTCIHNKCAVYVLYHILNRL